MRWAAPGWFLGAKKWSSSTCIASVIAKDKGLWKGLLRTKPPLLCAQVNVGWSAKDIGDLGSLRMETLEIRSQYEKKETNGIFLMALAECTHSWCNEREERLYETFSSALLGDQSQRALLKFLSDVLEIYWNVQVEEDLQEIARVARKLGLKKLPISFGLLRGKFQ